MCGHRLLDLADGAPCTVEGDHATNPGGHVYDGSSVPDGHDASEAAAEVSRG